VAPFVCWLGPARPLSHAGCDPAGPEALLTLRTAAAAGEPDNSTTAMVLYSDNAEAVEWVNMCWRKARRRATLTHHALPHFTDT